jgi:hypothetical protein
VDLRVPGSHGQSDGPAAGAVRLLAERAKATQSTVAVSHAVYVSQPEAVASIIAEAAAERASGS